MPESKQSEVPEDLKRLLCCPLCKGSLEFKALEITCTSCGTVYPIREGIPDLVPPETDDDSKNSTSG